MAITAATPRKTIPNTIRYIEVEAHESLTFYEGGIYCVDGDGYMNSPSDSAALIVVGVYTGAQAKEFTTGATDHDKLQFAQGVIRIPFSGAAQSDVGEYFFVSDNGTLTQTAGSKTYAFPCVGWESAGFVWIDFAAPMKVA